MFLHALPVGRADGFAVAQEVFVRFHVVVAGESVGGKFDFVRVEYLDEYDFEAPVQVRVQGLHEGGGIAQEVGDDDEGAGRFEQVVGFSSEAGRLVGPPGVLCSRRLSMPSRCLRVEPGA